MRQEWCHSSNREHFKSCTFRTKTEAIADAETFYRDSDTREYYLGLIEIYVPYICAEAVIEQILNDAYDECDIDDDYLNGIQRKDKVELEEQLNKAFQKWAKKTGNEPTFGRIIKIEKMTIRGELP